jgi:hypothetical protein
MLTVELIQGTVLDKEATTQKMREAGFSIDYSRYPRFVDVRLLKQERYKDNAEATAAALDCLVEMNNE